MGLAAGALSVTGLAPASAQDATPEPAASAAERARRCSSSSRSSRGASPQRGRRRPLHRHAGAGLGQTLYFSDRPDRIVGTSPTSQFLQALGFTPDDPPNAALVLENASGETDIAVVELI